VSAAAGLLQAGCSSCRPTISIGTLNESIDDPNYNNNNLQLSVFVNWPTFRVTAG